MMDPGTLLIAGAVTSAASSAVGGIMQYQQGQYAQQVAMTQSQYQQTVSRQNQEFYTALGEHNAQQATADAEIEEASLRRENARRLAAMRAALAAQGTTLEGSPIEFLADQAWEAEEAALLVRRRGEVETQRARLETQTLVRNEQLDEMSFKFGGEVASARAQQQATAGLIGGGFGAASSLLGGYTRYKLYNS